MKTPEGYKQTEVGVIPEDWQVKTVEDIFELPSASVATSIIDKDYYIGTENMRPNKGGIELNTINIKYNQVKEYRKNDILMSNIRPYLKKIWLADRDGGCSSDVLVFRVKGDEYVHRLLYNLLSEDRIFQTINGSTIGTKMPRGDKNVIKSLLIPLPSTLAEQNQIATVLQDIDDLISILDRQIEKKRQIKEGAMQQLLTGKTRLPGFKQPWVEKTIEEIGLLTGAGVDKTILYDEQAIRLVNYLDVFRRNFIYDKELNYWVTANDKKISQCSIYKGDLFFTPSSEMPYDIALSAVAMEDMKNVCYSYHIYRLRFIEDIDLIYKAYMFKSKDFYEQANQTCEGSGKRYVISLSKFRNLRVYYPLDIKEQKAIASVLYDMDEEIRQLEAERNKYTLIKQGMMQELLTGKTRVK